MRRFFKFLLIIILLCGSFILVTNGLYYWFSQPILAVYNDSKTTLDAGLPDSADSQAGRLAFYQDNIDRLSGLPAGISDLNQQVWAFAVLIREDLSVSVPALLDYAMRGHTAVEAYYAAVRDLQAQTEAFHAAAGVEGDTFAKRLTWYASRVATVDHLEQLYADFAKIPDIDMAGQPMDRAELGLADAADEVSPFREPIIELQALIAQSDELEKQLDELYALTPDSSKLGEVRAACGAMLARQDSMLSAAAALNPVLPVPLQSDFDSWSAGLGERTVFIRALQTWWREQVLLMDSIAVAQTDRATAKRYIADSLTEENVETAYLWTRTAEQYKISMATAIDFANIYISRANEQSGVLNASRPVYRAALGFDPDVRPIEEIEAIDPEAFWLES